MSSQPEAPVVDPVSLEIFRSALTAIAEEMGAVLTRSSYSPNIKERRDFSCALFDRHGRLVAQAAHIPVHLGSMPDSVAAALAEFERFLPGDVIALNDPFLGGTHLPDITLISPLFVRQSGERVLAGFAANRAHHADIGGISAGSMPIATEIYQEGIIIPPIKLWEAGEPNQAALRLLLRNVRTPDERRGDLTAQVAANRTAARRVQELVERAGLATLNAHIDALIDYGERITRATIEQIPDGVFTFTDYLDDDGVSTEPIAICATVTVRGGEMTVDFTGTAPESRGSINAVAAVAKSASYYVVRCLMPEDAPSNHGTFAPVTVIAPAGTVVNARPPRPVAGGNVETSQRITDVIFGALAQALPDIIPAASQGTMNNVTAGGTDPRTGQPFAYYETMGGGMGARPGLDGLSGVHVHMSNTLNTPVEAFEFAYPMRITEYRLRDGSGGAGAARGGDGLVREIAFETLTEVTLLTERRRIAPWGLQGGEPGERGANVLLRDGVEEPLPGKVRFMAEPGDRLSIRSPGGGGWGRPTSR
ncbi:MAG TPA: hydantoinase B/oxoprolinase family protein [Thermomicrobiales bacterium]|nr:hydantoinase B/oxoprolinase family protein [Thermomicrobiales bacterium]